MQITFNLHRLLNQIKSRPTETNSIESFGSIVSTVETGVNKRETAQSHWLNSYNPEQLDPN